MGMGTAAERRADLDAAATEPKRNPFVVPQNSSPTTTASAAALLGGIQGKQLSCSEPRHISLAQIPTSIGAIDPRGPSLPWTLRDWERSCLPCVGVRGIGSLRSTGCSRACLRIGAERS